MRKTLTDIAVAGDTLLEIYLNNKNLRIGGAGNVATHLNQWTKTSLFIPKFQSEQLKDYAVQEPSFYSKNIFDNSFIETRTGCFYLPLRIWNSNQVQYKFNSNNWNFVLDRDYLFDTLSYFNFKILYLEMHFKKSYSLNFMNSLIEAYKEHPEYIKGMTIYLDARHPELVPLEFLGLPFKCIYWKMNDIEFSKVKNNSFLNDINKNTLIINTHGSEGTTILHKDKEWYTIFVKPTGHLNIQSCGCGDSFFSMFSIANEIFDLTLEEGIKLASVAGGIAASKEDVVTVTPQEIFDYLRNTKCNYYRDDRLLAGMNKYLEN